MTLSCGEDTDTFGPDLLQMAAARLAHSRVEILPGIGHFGPLQRPAVVAGSILATSGSGDGTTPP